jgi:hypothetical protein
MADPDGLSRDGRPATIEAARNGHLDCLALLIARGADLAIKLHNGCGPLHYAASHGRLACVKALIKCFYITKDDRDEALDCALLNDGANHADCAQALAQAGAVPKLDRHKYWRAK